MKIISVVAARPNFMKIAPFVKAINSLNKKRIENKIPLIEHYLVHTGQHYDGKMSNSFFASLNIPNPDVDLGIGSGTHAEQVGRTMIAFEKILQAQQPDWVVVVGDVNATCACSITAKKAHVKLAHIESGLRSFDLHMPEEINRMVTDRLSDLLFTTDNFADNNLRNEGVPEDKIKRVGNIMIDTLLTHRAYAESLNFSNIIVENNLNANKLPTKIIDNNFVVLTLHRPSNVDTKSVLSKIVDFIIAASNEMPIIWPIHPRTRKQLERFGLWDIVNKCSAIILLDPLSYHELMKLNIHSRIVMTDSGGLQEECCVLGTPCMTMRWNTERPATLQENGGVCILVGNDYKKMNEGFDNLKNQKRQSHIPELWDGHTAERIVNIFAAMA